MNNFLEIIYTFIQGQVIRRIDYFDIPKRAFESEKAFLVFLKAIYENDLGRKVIPGKNVMQELFDIDFTPNYDQDIRKISTALYSDKDEYFDNSYWPKFIKNNGGKWYFENGLDWSTIDLKESLIDLSEIELKHFARVVAKQLQAIERHNFNIN